MSDAALAVKPETDAEALATPFLKALVRLMRAEDSYGTWEGKSDASLLKDFIVTKEQRREMPIIDDPDPDVLWRVEMFYKAAGIAIEEKTRLMASPMLKMSHEGFGRLIMTTGKLVIFSKSLRDVHRFGFDTLAKLAADGEKVVSTAIDTINTYPDVANA
jgi:probable nitrogen fixation protein